MLSNYDTLNKITDPAVIKTLTLEQCEQLARECREFMLQSLNQTGGHMAASFGVVELTIALLKVFQPPQDAIIWDVGHQGYPYKILTGRAARFASLRQKDGLSGFLERDESPYDAFGAGHSSTSISAALGMAVAFAKQQQPHKAIAVIGDGALTAGMAFEALHHAGALKNDLLVILNDNEMSISENVGGLSHYLAKVLASRPYQSIKQTSKKLLGTVPSLQQLAHRTESHLKGMITPSTLFEELGFNYSGPLDGHNLAELIHALNNLSTLKGPQFLHIVTQKGKGYAAAENDPIAYHGVSPGFLDPKPKSSKPKTPTYSNIFGQWLCDMAAVDDKLVGITPAMREGSDLVEFSKRFADRYFDVAIAEQHALTFAAGLACHGLKPVVAIYSTFLQRAYDQLIHDIALQKLPVLLAIDRAGLVGADAPTHTGAFDLSYLNCIPNMLIMAPSNAQELRQMLSTGFYHDGPAAVRYPRGATGDMVTDDSLELLTIGQAKVVRQGSDIALLSFGTRLEAVLEAGQELNATVVNMRFVKPLDTALIDTLASAHQHLIIIEENTIIGGAGSAVSQYCQQKDYKNQLLCLGLPDCFMAQASPKEQLAQAKLDASGIKHSIEQHLQQKNVKIASVLPL